MNQYLVIHGPENRTLYLNLVENYFTTGRFKEGNQHILKVRSQFSVPSEDKDLIVLEVFAVSNFIGLNEFSKAADHLDILVNLMGKKPQDFKLGWYFTGTKYFIRTNKALEPHGKWLVSFFTALEKDHRDAILTDLKRLRQQISKNSPGNHLRK